jgi:hypothetical protein
LPKIILGVRFVDAPLLPDSSRHQGSAIAPPPAFWTLAPRVEMGK